MFEINPVKCTDHPAGFTAIQNSKHAAGTQHPPDLAQARVIIHQVPESEGRRHQIEVCIGQRQLQRVGLNPPRARILNLGPDQHGVREVSAYNLRCLRRSLAQRDTFPVKKARFACNYFLGALPNSRSRSFSRACAWNS